MNREQKRLQEFSKDGVPWKKWGPYLSERQWGTVREDYSDSGDAWHYFSHDQARSRAYRWGEDGLAGISDDQQRLCFALTLWNGQDSILKERLFGLTNSQGNHGEDVKEYYFYLDNTPCHTYMKYLYKYPQAAYPYENLVQTNCARSRQEFEYELLDTGIFSSDRYFDVFVEYAKASPEDLLIAISAYNRGDAPAELHLLPTLWFRNNWSWGESRADATCELRQLQMNDSYGLIKCEDASIGRYDFYYIGHAPSLFTDNETNFERIYGTPNRSPYVKDGINSYIVNGLESAINSQKIGTKCALHYHSKVEPGSVFTVQLRLIKSSDNGRDNKDFKSFIPFDETFSSIMIKRKQEADEFYRDLIPTNMDREQANVMRQALSGMLWSKQYYCYDVDKWLEDRGANPFKGQTNAAPRNDQWYHLDNADIISMPDKWEYPWYASWDLAFHVLALSLVDMEFAKEQLNLILKERYLHPNGQIPAYEWNFSDVNPPVHAWSTIFTYRMEQSLKGTGDQEWLENIFQKLLLNFTWWVNRKDRYGRNVFEGGFLGLDNIGVFDRGAPLPTGGYLEQADGTAWMALYCLNMLEIALELSHDNPVYGEMSIKFAQHFLLIASSMMKIGYDMSMWDDEDGFFYDVLRLPDGQAQRLKVRSIVGLLPMCATIVVSSESLNRLPAIAARFAQFFESRPELIANIHDFRLRTAKGLTLVSVLSTERLRRILSYVFDEAEFLSPYGIRSLSRHHADFPYIFQVGSQESRVAYTPAESDTGMFGGNSNWRGPVWFPINILIIRALLVSYEYYGDDFRFECPVGSGKTMNLLEAAQELNQRLTKIFLPNEQGERPLYGGIKEFQHNPYWRNYILFHEYFHGDNGCGLGASHQTGWTGTIARLMHYFATMKS